MIEEKINNKELKKYKNWDKTKNDIVLLPDESEEVQKQQEAEFKELAQNILAKYHNKQTNFFDALEAKYGGKAGKGGKGKKSEYDIDDEEFERIQANRSKKTDNNKKGRAQDEGINENGRKKVKK